MDTLLTFLFERDVPFEENVSLTRKTWIKTGGVCNLWIAPTSVNQLKEVCRYLFANNIFFDLVGQTSNMFFHSTYNPKVVISTVKVREYKIEGDIIICDCGLGVIKLAVECMAAGYSGFYGLLGLPGTVASAAVNNSGCFNCSISSMLISADVLMPDGTVETISKEGFRYSHRSSAFKRGEQKGIILSLRLHIEKSEDIAEESRKAVAAKCFRKRTQEGYKGNLGSVFGAKKQRRNVRNLIAMIIVKFLVFLHIANQRRIRKHMLLWLYGYSNLDNYISDKNLNIFVWRDTNAEQMFERYKRFMSKVHKDLVIEIEERK